jgi:hypothetical protein
VEQMNLFPTHVFFDQVWRFILNALARHQQPSARELLEAVEKNIGLEARWDFRAVLLRMSQDKDLTGADRRYCQSILEDGSVDAALRGEDAPDEEALSTIDALLHQSQVYRASESFQEMIDFMGRFRNYAPYNNMLVRLQNPACGFYATAYDWRHRFERALKEDARPMIILAPMHPVMLVYDVDQTEGKELPKELREFSRFEGKWNPDWMKRMLENANRHGIRVQFKTLSSTNSGFATLSRDVGKWKMRIVVHGKLDSPSRFGVLCHEMAHVLLGHLGSDFDHWWPSRSNLDRHSVEVEAESVAFIVANRLGLQGTSAAYVSRHLVEGRVPEGVSLDLIGKVAGKIERMAMFTLPKPKPKKKPTAKKQTR